MTGPTGELVPARRPLVRPSTRLPARLRSAGLVVRRALANPSTRAVVAAVAAVGADRGLRRLTAHRRTAPVSAPARVTADRARPARPVAARWAISVVEVTRWVRPVR